MEILQFSLLLASLLTHFHVTPVLTNVHLNAPLLMAISVYAYTHIRLHQGRRPFINSLFSVFIAVLF